MQFNVGQLDALSKYFADVSKILVGSAVIGFFIPTGAGQIGLPIFIGGAVAAFICLYASIKLVQ